MRIAWVPEDAVQIVASTPIVSSARLRWPSTWSIAGSSASATTGGANSMIRLASSAAAPGWPTNAGRRRHEEQQRKHREHRGERHAARLIGALVTDVVPSRQHDDPETGHAVADLPQPAERAILQPAQHGFNDRTLSLLILLPEVGIGEPVIAPSL